MTRKEILKDVPEEFEGKLTDFIDEVEGRVDYALECLADIKGINDLNMVESCFDELRQLKRELY